MAEAQSREPSPIADDVKRLAGYLERVNFAAYADLLQRPWRLAWLNWLGGVFRGLGIGIGFTIVAGVVLMVLDALTMLNLPVVGKYIAELVRIVQAELHQPTY
ncbi:DUF5665 domain-containing protein [Alicyclobacillus sp.]|uniref:DUF5665 domain-containing protein n=1 Tax=Alicyclobacillus sp. TaxID=61169 RepID=UPI0025C69C10|nr:DUF5665 domain-containing protein [Alicyclobacillus sp.]MCL6515397.1 DUF5665 domain-containing protein [Alicyclobacillus sp.]